MRDTTIKYHHLIKPHLKGNYCKLTTFDFNGVTTEGLTAFNALNKKVLIFKPLPKRTKQREYELIYINFFGRLTTLILNSNQAIKLVSRKLNILSNQIKADSLT